MACCRHGPNGGCCGEDWCTPPDEDEEQDESTPTLTWNHVVSGSAIHPLEANQTCNCKAKHVYPDD